MSSAPPSIRLREVGLRDGLQMVPQILSTEAKLQWLRAEAAAGVPAFEVTSFVSASRMPQFADAETMAAAARELTGIEAGALALNARGAERAIEAGVRTLIFVVSASQAHSSGNAGRSTEHALDEFRAVMARVRATPNAQRPRVLAGVATAFGCTMEGAIDPARVRRLIAAMAEAGADELALADTVGYANPAQVRALCAQVLSDIGPLPLGLHLHDTRGLGLANALAGLEAGVKAFDAALGGLGGCPFAPGASGNIAMEDLVYMLESMGLHTGVDLARLLEVRRSLPDLLPGVDLHGTLARAGVPPHQTSSTASTASAFLS